MLHLSHSYLKCNGIWSICGKPKIKLAIIVLTSSDTGQPVDSCEILLQDCCLPKEPTAQQWPPTAIVYRHTISSYSPVCTSFYIKPILTAETLLGKLKVCCVHRKIQTLHSHMKQFIGHGNVYLLKQYQCTWSDAQLLYGYTMEWHVR